jgi:hypothetical protein
LDASANLPLVSLSNFSAAIGYNIRDNNCFANANIKSLKVWNKAISDDNIKNNNISETPILYYNFNEGSGDSLTNQGSLKPNCNGEIHNATWLNN